MVCFSFVGKDYKWQYIIVKRTLLKRWYVLSFFKNISNNNFIGLLHWPLNLAKISLFFIRDVVSVGLTQTPSYISPHFQYVSVH